MSKKSLEQLGLKREALPPQGEDLADLPDFGSFAPPPPPGPYRFQLPANLSTIYDLIDINGKGQRIKAVFDKDEPLVITQAKDPARKGDPFETRLTNNERGRGKKGSGIVASDLDYLLKALGETKKPAAVPASADPAATSPYNTAYIVALQKYAGKNFGADITYSWRCSPDRDIRVATPGGGTPTVVVGQKGCGESYYEGDITPGMKNADGTMPLQITCQCGALLRAFANLDNFRA
jgi:hypothetical protein